MQRELLEKQNEAEKVQEDLEDLKESLRSEKQILAEVTSERDRLTSLYEEKDRALQVSKQLYSSPFHMTLLN